MASHNRRKVTTTHEGAPATELDPKTELATRVLTSYFGEDRFYETGEESYSRIKSLVERVAQVDPEYVARLIILARETFGLRSTPQALVVELSRAYRGDSLVSNVVKRICRRADDMTNIMAYAINTSPASVVTTENGNTRNINKKLPNQIKKGLAGAFTKFDEYQLQKHPKNTPVQLSHLYKLVHPTTNNDEQYNMWMRMLNDQLEIAETRETALSNAGQIEVDEGQDRSVAVREAKRDAFESMLTNKKMGYLAVLRNIVKFVEVGISLDHHKLACEFISNKTACANSGVMPFQLFTAYKMLSTARLLDRDISTLWTSAIEKALANSASECVKKLDGTTAIAIDLSGSMMSYILSEHSSIYCSEISTVLGALATLYCEKSEVYAFGTSVAQVELDKTDGVLSLANKISSTRVGHGTKIDSFLQLLIDEKKHVDTIQIFTDGQYERGAHSSFSELLQYYKDNINPYVVVYEVLLSGYSNTALPLNKGVTEVSNNYYTVSGWSDATLKHITEFRQTRDALQDMVNAVDL